MKYNALFTWSIEVEAFSQSIGSRFSPFVFIEASHYCQYIAHTHTLIEESKQADGRPWQCSCWLLPSHNLLLQSLPGNTNNDLYGKNLPPLWQPHRALWALLNPTFVGVMFCNGTAIKSYIFGVLLSQKQNSYCVRLSGSVRLLNVYHFVTGVMSGIPCVWILGNLI